MDKSISDEVNEELNSLDILNDSFLPEKNDNEEEIGVIEDEKTKKLLYYVLKVINKKLLNILKRIEDADSHGYSYKVVELAKSKEELSVIEARHKTAVEMLSSALIKYIKPGNKCPVYFVKSGWKVVKPKSCDTCFMSDLKCDNISGKVIPGSEKLRSNYKYN